ncbi:uncharacterized protein CIMG_12570 [Coccidioides immitis RS]|uniref:Uncharacterized protein n=1 Tax=Coccidioides immitis (strain RS) TaxID=246410 RepID=J3K075_COCIM|nr:uncharacterized protein CIMG_12570 [Coccidioides immitis RS]EAS27222.3 hypothetical protein CIMG_12570 [Coccidioides immitis RS]
MEKINIDEGADSSRATIKKSDNFNNVKPLKASYYYNALADTENKERTSTHIIKQIQDVILIIQTELNKLQHQPKIVVELQEQATLIKFILEKKKQKEKHKQQINKKLCLKYGQPDYKIKFCTNSSNKSQQTDKKNKNYVKTRAAKPMQDPDQILERQSVNLIEKTSRHKQAVLLNSVNSISYKLASQLDWDQPETPMEVIKMLNRAETD